MKKPQRGVSSSSHWLVFGGGVVQKGGPLATWGVISGVALEPAFPLYRHGTSPPCPRERYSPSHVMSEAPLLPVKSLRSSWTRTHGWHPDSHLESSDSGWADPCCCLVSRSFLASKKRWRETLSRPFHGACYTPSSLAWSAGPAHPTSGYSLPPAPCFLGPSCSVLQFLHKPSDSLPQDLCI